MKHILLRFVCILTTFAYEEIKLNENQLYECVFDRVKTTLKNIEVEDVQS